MHSLSASLPSGPAALFIAHPGHELCLHGWLETVRPQVFVLTDGSGATGRPRLESTKRVLQLCGCESAPVDRGLSDQELYRAILRQEVAPCARMVDELAESLAARHISYVVADSWELYNPAHDLCRVMADLAVALVTQRTRRPIGSFDYEITRPRPQSAVAVTIVLDEPALRRKMQAAEAYTELRAEVAAIVAQGGVDRLRRERLYAVERPGTFEATNEKPFYEVRGEEQVRAGRYTDVLRYLGHFVPFVERLSRAVGVPYDLEASDASYP